MSLPRRVASGRNAAALGLFLSPTSCALAPVESFSLHRVPISSCVSMLNVCQPTANLFVQRRFNSDVAGLTKNFHCSICFKQFRLEAAAKFHVDQNHKGQGATVEAGAGPGPSAAPASATTAPSSGSFAYTPSVYQTRVALVRQFIAPDLKSYVASSAKNFHFHCSVCSKRFRSEPWARKHVLRHRGLSRTGQVASVKAGAGPWPILAYRPLLQTLTPSSSHVVERTISDLTGVTKNFHCSLCFKQFRLESAAKIHVDQNHKGQGATVEAGAGPGPSAAPAATTAPSGGGFACTPSTPSKPAASGGSAFDNTDFNSHVASSAKNARFHCSVCFEEFSSKSAAKKHVAKKSHEGRGACVKVGPGPSPSPAPSSLKHLKQVRSDAATKIHSHQGQDATGITTRTASGKVNAAVVYL